MPEQNLLAFVSFWLFQNLLISIIIDNQHKYCLISLIFRKRKFGVLMKKRIIVFAPHPDDETFGCGGVMAKRNSERYNVNIVVLTDGRHAYSTVLGI